MTCLRVHKALPGLRQKTVQAVRAGIYMGQGTYPFPLRKSRRKQNAIELIHVFFRNRRIGQDSDIVPRYSSTMVPGIKYLRY